jgi:hypothetical protein
MHQIIHSATPAGDAAGGAGAAPAFAGGAPAPGAGHARWACGPPDLVAA